MTVSNRKALSWALKTAIDVGGMFTDVVLLNPETQSFHYAQTPTTLLPDPDGDVHGGAPEISTEI